MECESCCVHRPYEGRTRFLRPFLAWRTQNQRYTKGMEYSLLDIEDYDAGPTDPARKFATLEQKARRNLLEILDHSESNAVGAELRSQYIMLMTSAARALGIAGVEIPDGHFENEWEEYQTFSIRVRGVIAEIMLNASLVPRPHSVALSSSTKGKIESQIIVLRGLIENSNLDSKRRARLIGQLDEFASELNRPRLNYAVAMSAMALFLSGMQGSTSTLADAPSAIQTVGTILKWIGIDKDAEDNERERLGSPPPKLEAPKAKPKPAVTPPAPNRSFGGFTEEIDDDVPF